jgi:hypothetical protein
VDALEADQLLLPQRQWKRITVGRTAVSWNRRSLGIGQPSVRLHAAQEVAAHRAWAGSDQGRNLDPESTSSGAPEPWANAELLDPNWEPAAPAPMKAPDAS